MNNTYITTSEKCKVIKKHLQFIFGRKDIGVYKGTGTASHWITINMPRELHGQPAYSMIKTLAIKALEDKGMKPDTYISDDGYDSKGTCISVHFNK